MATRPDVDTKQSVPGSSSHLQDVKSAGQRLYSRSFYFQSGLRFTMEEHAQDTVLKYKHFSVAVKEINSDSPNVEVISISKALTEILVKDPVCGRSDYSDLPGVRRDFRSPWRSFAEYPRSANFRQRGNSSVTSEERHRRNYLARIRRENLTLQRVAKRERLRAQQRERNRQRNLLYKLQNQAPENGECILLNPGVIISSPHKGSPGKLWKDSHRNDSKYQNKRDCVGIGVKYKYDGDLQKSLTDSEEKSHGVSDSSDQLQTVLDEVVSTTSMHRPEEKTTDNFKCPMLSSEVPSKTLAVSSFLGESEDNPVTSSQDSTEKSQSYSSIKPTPNNDNKSSVATSWTVTSTTAPEIVDADSSTPRTLKRKTRNVKRVNYTEMLEDDDSDQDVEQQFIRESKTSGRKIRPVKRTLEKAIVDASMKKSPRKRRASVVTKRKIICSQTASAVAANTETENDKLKQTINFKIMPLTPAAPKENTSNHKANMSSENRLNELSPITCSVKTPAHSLAVSTTGVSQHQTLMSLNSVPHVSSAHNLHQTGNLPLGHLYLSNPFESNKPAGAALTCQPISFNQQFYSTPSGHNFPQNLTSIIPSPNIQYPTFPGFSNFNLVMQSPFLKPIPLLNPQGSNKYLLSNISATPMNTQIHNISATPMNTQIHNISQQLPSNLQPNFIGSLVCDMNQSVNILPNFLQKSHILTSTPNSNAPNSVGTSQHVVRQDASLKKEEQLIKSAVVSDVSRNDPILPEKNVQMLKQTPNEFSSPKVTARQNNIVSDGGNMATEEKACNMPQHFLSGPEKNLSQIGSAGLCLSATSSDNKGNTEAASSCKMQSQLDVQTMLSSIYKNFSDGRNIGNSNKEINKRVQLPVQTAPVQSKKSADNIPTVAPRMITVADVLSLKVSTQSQPGNTFSHTVHSSGSKLNCMTRQTPLTKPCHQSLQKSHDKSIGPPPPLISISDLLNLPTNVESFEKNNGISASVSYQDNRPFATYQNKHAAISVAQPTSLVTVHTPFTTNERTSHQSDNSRERSAVTAHPCSTTQHHLINSLHQQSVQSQPTYPQLRHLYVQSGTDRARFVQENSGFKQAHLPGMPALLASLNCPILAGSGNTGYQKNRMPVPELPRSFQIVQAPYHLMSPTNTTPERIVAPGAMTNQTQQIPTPIRSQLDNMPKTVGVHRLTSARRLNRNQIRALVKQVHFQNQRPTLMPNSVIPVITQSASTTLPGTCTSDFWRLPLFTQEPTRSMSGKSVMDVQYHNQKPQITNAGNCYPLQLNQQRVPSETVKVSTACHSENTRDTHLPRTSAGMQYSPSVNKDKQRSHSLIAQRVLDSLPNVPSTISTNTVVAMTSSYKSAPIMGTQEAISSSPSKSAVQTGKLMVVATSGTLLAADLKPVNSSLLCALDLSHKTYAGQISQTTHTTLSASSAPTTISLKQNQVTAAISTPRVAYDYPLTRSQIKQEFLGQSEPSETDNNVVLRPGLEKSLTSSGAGVTSTFSIHNSIPTTSFDIGQISKPITNSQEPIATNTSVTSKPTVNSTSSNLSELGHINIKVESHVGHRENTNSVSIIPTTTSSSVSQTPLLINTPQLAHTTVVTSVKPKPLSSLSTYLKSIVDTTKNVPTGSVLHDDQARHTDVDSQNSVPADPPTSIKATLPGLLNIKQEIHSRSTMVTITDTSVSQSQSSDFNSLQSSSNNTFLPSAAPNNSAFVPDTKCLFTTSGSVVASAIVSTEISLPHQNDQSSKSNGHHTLIIDREIVSDTCLTTTESAMITESSPQISQPIIHQATLSLTLGQADSTHTYTETVKSVPLPDQTSMQPANIKTNVDTMALIEKTFVTTTVGMSTDSLSVQNSSSKVTDVKPLHPFIATQASELTTCIQMPDNTLNQKHDGRHNKHNSNEPSANNILQLPLQSPSDKQPVGFSPKPYSITNDPLFAWCIDSPKHLEPFSLDDIAGSVSQFDEHDVFAANSNTLPVNSTYTVTVSVPCTEAGNLLPYTDTSSVDTLVVKEEPNTPSATLNQREIIDLCVSDNDEDDPLNIDLFSYQLSTSTSPNIPCIKGQEAPETAGDTLPVSETYVQPQTPDSRPCSVLVNSDKDITNPNRASISSSPAQSKCVGGQIIKSPLTGRRVVMSGEQMNYIRNRLARISDDLSSITTSNGSISPLENSVVSSLDSVKKTSGSERTVFNKDPASTKALPSLVESRCVELVRSKNKEQTNMFDSLEIGAGNSSSAKDKTHIVEVKKECIEPIFIDDDDDDDVVFIASSEVSHLSCDVMKQINNPSRTLGRSLSDASSSLATSKSTISPSSIATLFPSNKDQRPPSGSRSSQSTGRVLASVANWSDAQVAEWLKHHKLDRICPNLSSLDGRGLQRMAFEHQRDPDMFYTRVKKTLGLTFFQTMVICHSMKELNDIVSDDN